jgi:peptide/nickel transport system permease protein
MATLNYLIKRILQVIPVLIIVTIIIFFMIRLIPGDPASVILGDRATPEMVEILNREMGLDKPIPVQYGIFMRRLASFDLGDSIHYNIPVFELIGKRFKVTFVLTLFTVIFSVILSFPLGYIAGIKKDKGQDQVIRTAALVALSTPQFWIGLILMIIFSVNIKLFPVGGWGETWPEHIRSIILPAFTQALMTIALLTRNLRNGVVDILKMDYVDFARSKGIDERIVRKRHIIKNAMISYVTLISMRMAYMLGGSIIIETVFALPGIGALMIESIYSRDYAVIQAVVLIFAFLVITVNILTDLAYAYLDPRVTLD